MHALRRVARWHYENRLTYVEVMSEDKVGFLRHRVVRLSYAGASNTATECSRCSNNASSSSSSSSSRSRESLRCSVITRCSDTSNTREAVNCKSWRYAVMIKAVITIAIRLRHDYDEKLACYFFCSRRIASTRRRHAIRRSRIVVVSRSNRTHIVISITFVVVECIVVSSYRSRVAVDSQLWYRLTIRLRSDYDVSCVPVSIRRDSTRAKN